ncbi:hypothetical protein DFO63_4183 [Stenotrophomonas sp. AG209]|uniref:hypothetical protein n=1 Tax=Stenotrophomonas sp. AG209 TaxID=2183909 RepID=UPI000E5B22CF|nr:hypothetical protein [Stenotrophomonas sp. AG209]RIA19064.1 hypothetical protein DFO63_4183 [Stenotrophomonas sp. AG209]
MALRTPLILNQSTGRIEELAAGDTLFGNYVEGLVGQNRLINGTMRWWQRGTSFTSPGYSADRWYFNAAGVNTPSLSRNPITAGSVDTECIYFAKIAYGTITDAANHYVVLEQRIENVTTLAGRTVTVSFKVFNSGSAGRQIAVELGQFFGASGSAQVSGIGAAKYSLAAGLNTITHTAQLPSISGKTVGANSSVVLTLWASGGSNFNARNASLGAQTGDVHFTQVQLEAGSSASAFDYRSDALELALCQRYYEKSYNADTPPATVTTVGQVAFFQYGLPNTNYAGGMTTAFKVSKRADPSITLFSPLTGATGKLHNAGNANDVNGSATDIGQSGFFAQSASFGPTNTINLRWQWAADAEL